MGFTSHMKRMRNFADGMGAIDAVGISNPVLGGAINALDNMGYTSHRGDVDSNAYKAGEVASYAMPIGVGLTAGTRAADVVGTGFANWSKRRAAKSAAKKAPREKAGKKFRAETEKIGKQTQKRETANDALEARQKSRQVQERRKATGELKDSLKRSRRAGDKTPPSARSNQTKKIVEELASNSKKKHSYAAYKRKQARD